MAIWMSRYVLCRSEERSADNLQAATELQAMVERVLGAQPLSAPEKLGDRSLLLPEGESIHLH